MTPESPLFKEPASGPAEKGGSAGEKPFCNPRLTDCKGCMVAFYRSFLYDLARTERHKGLFEGAPRKEKACRKGEAK